MVNASKQFGPWVKVRREELGLSASFMARRMEMAWSHWFDMERGRWGAPRSYERLRKIAELLKLPVVEVYEQAGALPPDWLELAEAESQRRAVESGD